MKIDLSSPAIAQLISSFTDTCKKYRAKIKFLESKNKELAHQLHLTKSATIGFMMTHHGMSWDDANNILNGRLTDLSVSSDVINSVN